MAFEEFTKKTARAAGTAYVTIQKRGMFALNHAAYAAIGEPKAVSLSSVRDRRLVGIRAANTKSEHAYPFRPNCTNSSHIVSGTLFTKHHGIPTEIGRRLRANLIEGDILAIDVSNILDDAAQ